MNENEKNLSGYGFSFKDYIRILENPDKIGLNNGIWSAPILKGYDKNQRGYGIDINTNKKAKALTNNRPGRWLTEKEADTLMDDHINYITEAANKHIKGFSELPFRRRWALLGMLYRGDSVNKSGININEPDDLKFFKSISNYYRSKGLNARANSSDEFFNRPVSKLLSMFKLKNGGYIRKMQTGAGGGFTSLITVPFLPNIKEIRHRLYNGINPSGYQHIPERIWDALNKKKANRSVYRDDQWATYLQIPEEERHSGVEKLQPARYRPSIGNTNGDVYRIPLNKEDADVLILRALLSGLGLGKNMVDRSLAHYLGDHTVGRGYDEKGEYISYYDKYDLNPFTGGTAIKTGVKEIDKWLKDNTSNIDMSMGIGKPFEIYDRIYLDDYYKVPKEARGATYLPEIIVTGKKKQGGKMNILEFLKNGSGIHIKEKNKGKFTSYCGGKVTDECIRKAKASGNPTLVKRATFAANARKWKHKEGGIIIKAADGTKTNFFLKVENFLNSDLGKTVGIGLVNAFSNWTSSNKLNNAIDSLIEGLKKQNKADINSIQNWALQKATEEVNLEFNKLLLLFNSGASFEQPSPIVFEHLKSQLASKYAQKAIDYVNLNSQEDIANLESLKTNPISDVFSSLANTGINYFANKALNKNGVPSSRNTNTSFYSNPYLKTLNKVGTINSNGSMNTGIGGTTYNWNTNTFGSNNTMNSFGNIKF